MDPDKALELLQQKMTRIQQILDSANEASGRVESDDLLDELEEVANEAVDLWNGLDRWMREAGALPRDWARHR